MIPPRKATDPAREAKPLPDVKYPPNPSPSAWLGRRIWDLIQRLKGG